MYSSSSITFPGLGITVDPSPVAFTIFGKEIYWYGIVIACGMLAAFFLMCRKSRSFGLNEDNVLDMLMSAVPIGIVGARAYYCLFYWSLFKNDPISVFYIWEGGLAIYGGIIMGAVGLLIYCRFAKKPVGTVLDVAAFGVIVGQIAGRWGNFFNREAYGGVTTLPWGMGVGNMENGVPVLNHPTFLYESLWNLIGLLIMSRMTKKRKYDGQVFTFYVFWYGLGRAWIEGLRTDSLYLFGTGIRVSQLLAVLCVWAAGALLIINLLFKKHDPKTLYANVKAGADSAPEGDKTEENSERESVTETGSEQEKKPEGINEY